MRYLLSLILVAMAFAALPRALVATLSVVHWDESIYTLVARDLKNGIMPFLGVFDHKPVALYYVYGLAQALLGETILALRLLAVAVAATGAFLIGLYIYLVTDRDRNYGMLAASMYGLLSATNGGLVAQPELLMNIAMVGIWLFQARLRYDEPDTLTLLSIGAVMGFGFSTNYLFGFTILAFCVDHLLCLSDKYRIRMLPRKYVVSGIMVFLGFALTLALLLAPVFLAGALPGYLQMQVEFLSGYAEERSRLATLSDALIQLRPYALLTSLFAATALVKLVSPRKPGDNPHLRRALIYFAFALLAALASNRGHGKYFLLILPAGLVLLTGMLREHLNERRLTTAIAVWLILLAAVSLETERAVFKQGVLGWLRTVAGAPSDLPARIARDIAPELRPGETIYVYEYQPILYYLTATEPPTKFANSIHHLHENYVLALGLDRVETMTSILRDRPRFVIAGSDPAEGRYGASSDTLAAVLAQDYELIESLTDPFFHVLYGRAEWDNPVYVYEYRSGG